MIDQNNCLQTIEVELTQPDDLLINYNVTNETCTNANDGSISLDIQGGVLDYEISWSNFANGPIQNNLAPGLYSVTVTDGNNCVEEVTIEIEDKLRKSWAESMDSLHGISLIPFVFYG